MQIITDIKNVKRAYYEQYYTNKFDRVYGVDQFLEKHSLH